MNFGIAKVEAPIFWLKPPFPSHTLPTCKTFHSRGGNCFLHQSYVPEIQSLPKLRMDEANDSGQLERVLAVSFEKTSTFNAHTVGCESTATGYVDVIRPYDQVPPQFRIDYSKFTYDCSLVSDVNVPINMHAISNERLWNRLKRGRGIAVFLLLLLIFQKAKILPSLVFRETARQQPAPNKAHGTADPALSKINTTIAFKIEWRILEDRIGLKGSK